MAGLTYRDAGVDIDAAEGFIERIKPLAARTRIPEVLGSVGGFAGLCAIPEGIADPILVSGTDGVGTKLKLAFESGIHGTVGIDLVAMCVNDVLTTGARPLFFLDYFATGKLDADVGASVVEGIAKGCERSGCALLGGETAELPGFYPAGEYDLAGFAVGVVSRASIVDGKRTRAGDRLIGLPSSGLHSNGFSLARKALLERGGLDPSAPADFAEGTVAEALLEPTRIYARAVAAALAAAPIHAMSHITGGGLPGNLPRVLPEGLGVRLDPRCWSRPPVFDRIASLGGVSEEEMYRTFNMGLGFVFATPAASAETLLEALRAAGEAPVDIGEVLEADADSRVRIGA